VLVGACVSLARGGDTPPDRKNEQTKRALKKTHVVRVLRAVLVKASAVALVVVPLALVVHAEVEVLEVDHSQRAAGLAAPVDAAGGRAAPGALPPLPSALFAAARRAQGAAAALLAVAAERGARAGLAEAAGARAAAVIAVSARGGAAGRVAGGLVVAAAPELPVRFVLWCCVLVVSIRETSERWRARRRTPLERAARPGLFFSRRARPPFEESIKVVAERGGVGMRHDCSPHGRRGRSARGAFDGRVANGELHRRGQRSSFAPLSGERRRLARELPGGCPGEGERGYRVSRRVERREERVRFCRTRVLMLSSREAPAGALVRVSSRRVSTTMRRRDCESRWGRLECGAVRGGARALSREGERR